MELTTDLTADRVMDLRARAMGLDSGLGAPGQRRGLHRGESQARVTDTGGAIAKGGVGMGKRD